MKNTYSNKTNLISFSEILDCFIIHLSEQILIIEDMITHINLVGFLGSFFCLHIFLINFSKSIGKFPLIQNDTLFLKL